MVLVISGSKCSRADESERHGCDHSHHGERNLRHGSPHDPRNDARNGSHRRFIPELIGFVAAGKVDVTKVLTQVEPMTDVIGAYKAFDKRKAGWIKVELQPVA